MTAEQSYSACVFDLDGTLANTLASIAGFGNGALAALSLPPLPVGRYRRLVGNGAGNLMRGMLREGGHAVDEAALNALRGVYDELYEAAPLLNVTNYDGVPELVAALRALAMPMAVLSNKPDDMARAVAAALFPKGSFSVCHGQREGVARKPSPEGALLCARELGVLPGKCLYIGDTDVDMRTGAAAGMDTCGVLWGFRNRRELLENGANYIVENPAAILEIVRGEGAAWRS